MLRIGICDDSIDARCALRGALERVLEIRGVECGFFEFSSGEGLLGWMENHTGELELVFLDIEMNGMNGMDTARALRKLDEKLMLVFVTGYTDYVFDGYSVGALGYLLKPAKAEQLEDLMGRVLGRLYQDVGEVFLCKNAQGVYRIPRQSILYFASDRRKVLCVTEKKTYEFYGKLDDVAREMGGAFVRIHQRYLVRCGAVDRVESGHVVIGDTTLPMSRACQAAALAAIARANLEG